MIILNVMLFKTGEAQTQGALTEMSRSEITPHSSTCSYCCLLFLYCLPSVSLPGLGKSHLTIAWLNSTHTSISTLGGVTLVFGFRV